MKLIKKLVLICCCVCFFSALSAQNALENWNTITTELKQLSETSLNTTFTDKEFNRFFESTPSNLQHWIDLNEYRIDNSISVSTVTSNYFDRVINGMQQKN